MGIRLVCPQGHKLHVKSFLAGKRAICPHCGEKVLVPLANEAPAAASQTTGSSNFGELGRVEVSESPETAIDLADVPTKGLGAGPASRAAVVSNHAAPAIVPAAA